MNIYHMSYTLNSTGWRVVDLSFEGCNFDCIGCLQKKSKYNIYAEERKYIDWNFENIMREIKLLNPRMIYLKGYEPTLDPDLIRIIENLSRFNAPIALMSNGSKMDKEYSGKLKGAKLSRVVIGVKAFNREKHFYYTKNSNELVLEGIRNLAALENDRFRLTIETILLPRINEPADIEELAIFISEINPSIPLFVEPWIPVEGVEFEEPKREDLIEAVSRAMKHLYSVYYRPLYSEIKEIRKTPRKVKFVDVLPRREDDAKSVS